MSKILASLLTFILVFCFCACAGSNNAKLESADNTAKIVEEVTSKEDTTQEDIVKKPDWTVVSPENKDFGVKGDEITVEVSKNFDPYDRSIKITDNETKEKIYNMVMNIYECPPIDYTNFGKENIPISGCYRRAYVKAKGICYRVFISNTDDIYSNISIFKNQTDGMRNFFIDEDCAKEFSRLCGIEQPIIKI